ncbi:hypothetical protein M407DRAFT_30734 [Tulasnella calospora MUT 4182]|uniref:Uncharacterized protein n=1 Tax=Tulasnella calospora MUT 4182 TaxID=1051891 RepID=A0A0C3PX29_9AGAM|nr:hypothetical protein M407DRAFT_30734 [Tulasnella calospora MUT 4182]
MLRLAKVPKQKDGHEHGLDSRPTELILLSRRLRPRNDTMYCSSKEQEGMNRIQFTTE